MRIALVRRVCSLRKAGAERYCVNLFRNLQRLGHDVTIVGEDIDDELRPEVAFLKVPVDRWTSWTRNRSFAVNAQTVVESRSFDVVHGLSRVRGLDSYRLTDPLQTHWVRTYYRHPWRRRLEQWNPRHRAIFALERELFGANGPRRIIVQSQLDARLLQTYFRVDCARLRLVRNGVDLKVFTPDDGADRHVVRAELGVDERQPMFVFASMDFRRKGLDSLLAAMTRLPTAESVLVVLGNGDLPRYTTLARRLGLEGRVRFLGRQSQMSRFYRAADAFVLPTIYEPFPNVNLEAMACGTPVITTRTAGGADLVTPGENGWLISDAFAVEELAQSLAAVALLAPHERNRLRAACLETAARFPAERNARETLAVLEEARDARLCA